MLLKSGWKLHPPALSTPLVRAFLFSFLASFETFLFNVLKFPNSVKKKNLEMSQKDGAGSRLHRMIRTAKVYRWKKEISLIQF